MESENQLGFDPSFLKPPSDHVNIKHIDHYILHGDGKKAGRKIYHNVQFTLFEQQGIQQLKETLNTEQVSLTPDWSDIDYLKMCYCGRFDLKKCIQLTKTHVQWRLDPNMQCLDDKSKALLESGMIYVHGRDKQYRPVIILDCTKIDLKKQGQDTIIRALCVFLNMVRKYMFVGYYIENWILIIDTGGMGIFDLPLKALNMMIEAMSCNYCACMEKLFILNPSFGLKTSWSVISKMMDQESVDKIQMLKQENITKLQEYIDPCYLEQKFRGTVPNQTIFWPPVNIYK
ncbi:hypothetical protein IMG5_076430 [Ichthyophthirius multifiliis]|uniref:CRAL-TRIO domain-containing protein n=1 Tax=Ichthyophthirius multifiliis TaxID=5932 RepID=G0QQB2_ICHMU|nr:hypothetical protein IMG5_076430 [Ichthyophthirius multifiliis]EGR32613.1 hypothetical protein IMG5_076430 [Ichthyophthirius multifiliis]|eukprot:XP_004036599.1 hypothetical protein IMG5_076430 [Ichthyophthirius multifiliis]